MANVKNIHPNRTLTFNLIFFFQIKILRDKNVSQVQISQNEWKT